MARIIGSTVDGVMKTVAPHRLKELQQLQAVEKLVTWRTARGFDRVTDGEDNWVYGTRPLPPTPEESIASLWSELNALKKCNFDTC